MINEQMNSLITKEDKKCDISFCFEVSDIYNNLEKNSRAKSYTMFFVIKRKIVTKKIALSELKLELNRINKVKMVMILLSNNQSKHIHDTLSEISREKGICSPIIELENAILYFPELRYSDLGLLAFLCEQKINTKDYNLSMVSSNLIGGKYV